MSQRTATTTQLPKSRIRSARECQLIDAIEVYIARHGKYLEMASLGDERNGNPQFAKCRADLEASEAALSPYSKDVCPSSIRAIAMPARAEASEHERFSRSIESPRISNAAANGAAAVIDVSLFLHRHLLRKHHMSATRHDNTETPHTDGLLEPHPGENRLVRTAIQNAYPTSAHAYFYCEVLEVSGEEVEGGDAVFTATGEHLLANNLSGRIPPLGTKMLAREADGQWVIGQ